ncbi:hypothetical protein BU17DRAFT_83286 [Hysterangium stoloniferum]|nr:hypothetical protein BU17DRAFT_83286 [Hysterangium stoloniferum]
MLSSAAHSISPRARSLVLMKSCHLPFQPRFRSHSFVHGSDLETIEGEKQRNLEKKQQLTSTTHEVHAPGWNGYVASASEVHVKFIALFQADEEGPPTSELASKTVKYILERHGENTCSREEATYEKDEVQGPLKGSTTGTVDESFVKETLRKRTNNMTISEEDIAETYD